MRVARPVLDMTGLRVLSAFLIVFVVVGAGLAALAWRPVLPAVERAAADGFPPALVKRGAALAAIGDCAGCHSAPGQPSFSGGVPVETPFGTVYSSNVTPDPDTGIGRWSEAAFLRAMRDGVDRDGRYLYPAFPFDHYTLVTDEDDGALYAYLMSRSPVRRATTPDTLPFPLNVRAVMAGWDLLFLRPGPYAPTPDRDETWNRGAYLVEGLGHCGACHTPRNWLGAEERRDRFGGGVAEGWNAYALDASSPAAVPWTVDALAFYLGHGWQAIHGAARGPMAMVTANLSTMPESDARAMAVYLVSLMGRPSADRIRVAKALQDGVRTPPGPASAGSQMALASASSDPGAAIYDGACASCHASGRPVPFGGLALGLSSALHAPDPSNIVTVTLRGLAAPPGAPGAIMPGFAGTLDDGQIAALLAYLRGDVAHEAPWPELVSTVRAARSRQVTLYPSDGTGVAPANSDVRTAP